MGGNPIGKGLQRHVPTAGLFNQLITQIDKTLRRRQDYCSPGRFYADRRLSEKGLQPLLVFDRRIEYVLTESFRQGERISGM